MAAKKGKKTKSMGKKDLKRTKGGLLPAVSPTDSAFKFFHKDDQLWKLNPTIKDPGTLGIK